jgi:catechol 2,3-dioxygenase-like lactoylglutathione lyase family enzyme
MIKESRAYPTIPVTDIERAKKFYGETLGLAVAMDTPGGVMFTSGDTQLFVYPSRFKASGGPTQMGWIVSDIKTEVAALRAKGVTLEEYDHPGVKTVGGIAQSAATVWSAFFRDPDGNLLTLSQID